jgi:hypothetical protein
MGGRAVAISDMVFLRGIAMKGGDYTIIFARMQSGVHSSRYWYIRIQTCI